MPELNDTQTNKREYKGMFPLRRGMLLDPEASAEGVVLEADEKVVDAFETVPELEVTQPEVAGAEVDINDFRGQKPAMLDVPAEKEETNLDKTQEELEKEKSGEEVVETQDNQVAQNPAQGQPSAEPSVYDAYPAAKAFSKRMSNDARQFLEARLAELDAVKKQKAEVEQHLNTARSGRTQIPENYYENPNAYVLLPEFQSAQASTTIAQKIAQHWRTQKARVAGGQGWYDIAEVRDAQGRLVDIKPAAEEQKLDAEGQVTVDDAYLGAINQLQAHQNYAQSIAANFKQGVATRLDTIRKAEADIFAGEQWNKKDSVEYKTAEQVADGIKKLGITEANPAFGLLKKTGAAYMMLRDAYNALQKQQTQKVSVAQKQHRAGPTTSSLKSGGGGVASEEFDISEFKKRIY